MKHSTDWGWCTPKWLIEEMLYFQETNYDKKQWICMFCFVFYFLWSNDDEGDDGPGHICSRRSYYEHCEMFSVPIRSGWKWHASRSAQYDVLCIHCATCEVILMCTLCADSGLRAKPRPLRTLFSVHERSYLFWMCTKGAICSENMVWPCSSWNCSSGNNSL